MINWKFQDQSQGATLTPNLLKDTKNLLPEGNLLLIILEQEECHHLIKPRSHRGLHAGMMSRNPLLHHHDMMSQLFLEESQVHRNLGDLQSIEDLLGDHPEIEIGTLVQNIMTDIGVRTDLQLMKEVGDGHIHLKTIIEIVIDLPKVDVKDLQGKEEKYQRR